MIIKAVLPFLLCSSISGIFSALLSRVLLAKSFKNCTPFGLFLLASRITFSFPFQKRNLATMGLCWLWLAWLPVGREAESTWRWLGACLSNLLPTRWALSIKTSRSIPSCSFMPFLTTCSLSSHVFSSAFSSKPIIFILSRLEWFSKYSFFDSNASRPSF